MKTNNFKLNHLIALAAIIIVGFVVYTNSLNGKFVWDDTELIKDNVYIKSWSYIPQIFSSHIQGGSGSKGNAYRPIQIITYLIDYSINGLDEKTYHITNILLHIGVALVIYLLLQILFNNMPLSLLTSILFIVHPIHTEAITYISGRADPIAALFMLFCFCCYVTILSKNNFGIYAVMLISYILSLLSRENSLILPALLFLYHYIFIKKIKVNNIAPIVLISVIYIILRLTILRFEPAYLLPKTTLLQRLPGLFVAIYNYIRLLIFPSSLHMEYGNLLFKFTDAKAIAGIFISISLLTYAYKVKNKNNIVSFSIFWFFIAILPASGIYPINAYMAEHWLYIPSLGFFIILANLLCNSYRLKSFKFATVLGLVAIVCFYGYSTIKQNIYWRDPELFYTKTMQYAPFSSRLYNNLAGIYHTGHKYDEAINLYKKAIELNPSFAEIYNNLGLLYKDIGKSEDAMIMYKKAIEMRPNYGHSYNNLGLAYYDSGKYEEAISLYKKSIEISPNNAMVYSNLGNAYGNIGRNKDAMELYKKAIKIDPDYPKAYYNLALACHGLGKYNDAVELYKKAIELDPDYIHAYNNLGNTYRAVGKDEEAIALYKKAIEKSPKDMYAYNNLGNAYMAIGKTEEAVTLYQKATDIDPNNASLYLNLAIAYYYNKQYGLAIKHCDKAIELGYKVSNELLDALKPYRKLEIK